MKYPLFIIAFIVGGILVFSLLLIMSMIMILRGVLWDFKFQLEMDKENDKLTLIEMWKNSTDIPSDIWEETKNIFKI